MSESVRNCPACNGELAPGVKFCPHCGSAVQPQSLPPDAVPSSSSAGPRVRRQMSTGAKVAYALLAIGLFSFFLFLYVRELPGKPNSVVEKQPDVAMGATYSGDAIEQQTIPSSVENGKIVISLPMVLDKKIVAFDYDAGTTIVPLLAFINNQGKLVTAIRLCEPCNSKTFRIEGNELACGSCETHWKLDNLEGLRGNCMQYAPAPIPSEVHGNSVYIDEKIVRNWKIRM